MESSQSKREIIRSLLFGGLMLACGIIGTRGYYQFQKIAEERERREQQLLASNPRTSDVNDYIAKYAAVLPFPPGTQWVDLIVPPHYKTTISYIELGEIKGDSIVYLEKKWNNLGCPMDEDVPLDKPPGERRIVFIGDSYTEGFCKNSETIPSQVERLLHDKGMKQIRVINAGTSTSNPFENLMKYEHIVRLLKPDIIIYVASPFNDLGELIPGIRKYSLVERKKGYVECGPRIYIKGTGDSWESRIGSLRHQELEIRIEPLNFREGQPFTPKTILFTDEEIKLHGALSQTIEEFHRGLGAQVEQQLYILSSRDDIFREVKQRLAYCFWAYGQILQQDPDPPEFGMVLLPSPAAVNSPDLEGILRKMYTFFRTSGLKNFRTEEDFANPFREYAQSFMNMPQNRIVYPLEALKGRRGIFLEDLHYTVEGNTAVAELIAQNILADPGYLKRLQNSPVSKKRGLIIPQGEVRPFKPQGTRPSRKIGHRNKQEEFKPTSGDKALLSFAHSLRGRRPQIFKPQMWLRGH